MAKFHVENCCIARKRGNGVKFRTFFRDLYSLIIHDLTVDCLAR